MPRSANRSESGLLDVLDGPKHVQPAANGALIFPHTRLRASGELTATVALGCGACCRLVCTLAGQCAQCFRKLARSRPVKTKKERGLYQLELDEARLAVAVAHHVDSRVQTRMVKQVHD